MTTIKTNYTAKTLKDALETIAELAEYSRLDDEDPDVSKSEELTGHAHYQDDCFGIVYDFIDEIVGN